LDFPVLKNSSAIYLYKVMQRAPTGEKPFDSQPAFFTLRVMVDNADAEYGELAVLMPSFLKCPSLREYYCLKVGSNNDETGEDLVQLVARSPILKSERAN